MSNIWTLVHYLFLQGFLLLICKINLPVCSKYIAIGFLVTTPVGKINYSTKSLWASSHSSDPVEWGVGAILLTGLGANSEFYNVLKFECYTSTVGLIHNWMRKDISCSPTSLAWKHQRENYKLHRRKLDYIVKTVVRF